MNAPDAATNGTAIGNSFVDAGLRFPEFRL
jgi:hypothetical protein